MTRLSSSIAELRPHYTVVVVGSGYGGAISAARLARQGRDVCVLERGREWEPGAFPRSSQEAMGEVQVRGGALGGRRLGPATALISCHVDEEVSVVTGCGLGGTSLINASVALRPDARVFKDARWPAAFRADVEGELAQGFARAEQMLRPSPYPEAFPTPSKLQVLEQAAPHLGGELVRPPICVTFRGGTSAGGVEQKACNLCGDCITGCNRSAKNDLRMNYLPEARRWGASLFTEVEVRHVARHEGRWRVHYRLLGAGRERFDGPELFLTAEHVILSAGTLGTTEILLRSRERGLPLSGALGQRFSGNGDVMAFGYNLPTATAAVGHGTLAQEEAGTVGPCITGLVDRRQTEVLEEGLVIQEGAIPGALASILPAAFGAAALGLGEGREGGVGPRLAAAARALKGALRGARHGAVQHTQTFLVMSHDEAAGALSLEQDGLRVAWEGAGSQPVLERVQAELTEAVRRMGGCFVPTPTWAPAGGKGMVTVHPLGGCAMAEDAAGGVVDHEGRVFSGPAGAGVHEGLYVCDGAAIPRPLGANPLLTIAAIAERFCVLLARRQGWTEEGARPLPGARTPARAEGATGLRFSETLQGPFTLLPQQAGQGRAGASSMRLVVTVLAEDLEALLARPEHEARLVGTVEVPALSPSPLVITRGSLQLFVPDVSGSGLQSLRYAMQLRSQEGGCFFLEGLKRVRPGLTHRLWTDTTSLRVTLWRGETPTGVPLGEGGLRLGVTDLVRQLSTLQAPGARGVGERTRAVGRFVGFFAGALLDAARGTQPPAAPLH